jgi:hypothetical protein
MLQSVKQEEGEKSHEHVRRVEVQIQVVFTSTYIEVSDQLHAPAALPSGTYFVGDWDSPKAVCTL